MLFAIHSKYFIPFQSAQSGQRSSDRLNHASAGFSMLEVLFSLLIFSVGFLGLASLQHVALSATYDATLQNSAVELADSLYTRIQVEGSSVNLVAWQKQVSERLPNASGQLIKQNNHYRIHVKWQESRQAKSPLQSYQLGFRLYD